MFQVTDSEGHLCLWGNLIGANLSKDFFFFNTRNFKMFSTNAKKQRIAKQEVVTYHFMLHTHSQSFFAPHN